MLLTNDNLRNGGNDLEPSYNPTEFVAQVKAH